MKARHAIPDQIARCMRPEDRTELGILTAAEAIERGDARIEAPLQKACESYLSRHLVPYLHLSPRAREKAGWPDLDFPWRGHYLAVELKSPTGDLSPEQRECLAGLAQQGAITAVIRSYARFVELLEGVQWAEGATVLPLVVEAKPDS